MSRSAIRALAADVAAVVLFVVLGRSSHHEGGSWLSETVTVAAPFLIALGVAWLVTKAWRSTQDPWTTGVPIWLITVAGGVVLRRFAFDRSTATSFIVVATFVLGGLLVGWRALAAWRATTG